MRRNFLIEPCCGKAIDVKKGQTVTVIDVEGGQVADFFAEAADNTEEFLSTGVTVDCNESLALHVNDPRLAASVLSLGNVRFLL